MPRRPISVPTWPATSMPGLWQTAQVAGLVLTAALITGLWLLPDPTLRVLWYAVIPVLPAVFLLHPGVWRNVCPLATLNVLPGRRSRGLRLSREAARWGMLAGFALLALLVPARRFLFNVDGRALAIVIVAVALIALALGFVFDRRAGFCNALCPVLPVEKLYGQNPLMRVANVRCPSCSLCTSHGCIDLAPTSAVPLLVRKRGGSWINSPFGMFAAGFPGFVLVYNVLSDTTLDAAGGVYLRIAAGTLVSLALIGGAVVLFRLRAAATLPVLAAGTLSLYYWFAAASIATAWQLGTGTVHGIRGAAALLVGYWLWQRLATRRQPQSTATPIAV
jgi:nitrite reductase (NADH) large subunit